MSRRFQFSLRALLGLAAVVGLLLGGWHLLDTYGNRLDVDEVRIGAPVKIKAGYVCLFGPHECNLSVALESIDGSEIAPGIARVSEVDLVERSWLCLYRVEWEFEPVEQPCRLIVSFCRHEKFNRSGRLWTLKEKIMDVK
jgi:hypothetical protein